jgi:membrane peptidoglycan carboxypeptidase
MGVDLTDPPHERVPSFTLGVADVSPLEMAGAYATVAARGLHCDARPVLRILNASGETFKAYPKKCKQVMKQSTADTVNDILRGVMMPGGFGARLALNKPSAGKTGTTSSNKAVWFDGYTPALATVAMVAGANQQGQPISLNGQTVGGQYVASAHGSTTAGPMWYDAMAAIQKYLPDTDFVKPVKVNTQQPQGNVPSVIGMTVNDATTTLQTAGFQVSVGGAIYSDVPKGLVALSSPYAGSQVPPGSTITIYVSAGPAKSPGGGGPSPTGPGLPTATPTRRHGHGH